MKKRKAIGVQPDRVPEALIAHKKKEEDHPIRFINDVGYSLGRASEILGLSLEELEAACPAKGDEYCTSACPVAARCPRGAKKSENP